MIPYTDLICKAMEAAETAYAPYSNYHVGAALLTAGGKVFTGCNIENASFGGTNCAERTAFFKAVSEGYKDFTAIAVVGYSAEKNPGMKTDAEAISDAADDNNKNHRSAFSDYAYPCGICRQVMQEFCESDFEIIIAKGPDDYKKYFLKELLPFGFGGKSE